ncbi:MAG: tungstate ABC transporter substrate-binding protein WtpA [Planctomycetota bacterium]|jgi:molybdate/tungstate transport system substrate-binding protein
MKTMERLIPVFLVLLLLTINTTKSASQDKDKLIIFHAGSLSVPFKHITGEFNKLHPEVKILLESAGSRICARKISDLNKPCDVIAVADYTVIDVLLIPEHAEWNIKFASNEMVIAFREESRMAKEISQKNWYEILLDKEVKFSRSDPDSDPCGYRSVFTMILAEKFYEKAGLAEQMSAKDREFIRPKEVDLLALLEVGAIDYIFIYRSVAKQHKLKYITLPDQINLKNVKYADFYKTASTQLTGKQPGSYITKTASPIVYGVTIPKNAPNEELALEFTDFLLNSQKSLAIMKKNGQMPVVPSVTNTFEKIPQKLKKYALPFEKVEDESEKQEKD